MKKAMIRVIPLVFVLLFCLGCRSVSAVSKVSSLDLSTVIPEPDNPNNYMDAIRYAPIPTDRGIFHIVRDEDAEYVSFLTNDGEEIRLLKGKRFANLQLVQPYLYAVSIEDGQYEGTYSKLYRLDLSDGSLSLFPRYTVSYYALSDGEIIRRGDSHSNGDIDLYRSDWEETDRSQIYSGRLSYPLPQGDTLEWFQYISVYEKGIGDSMCLIRFSPENGVHTGTVWTDMEDSVWYRRIFTYNNKKYIIVDLYDHAERDYNARSCTVYALSDDGSKTALATTSYKETSRLYLVILPENAAQLVIDTIHPNVIVHEPLENGLCLLGIVPEEQIKIYTFDTLISVYHVTTGEETLIPIEPEN